ncbi:MAG: SEC-C domain-containing protein [Candidatus Aenigmarchaeota archaeon]|nr:SEC-C domain-containing protein [Candidatus Aenigmarchaeota archaeon]
MKDILIPLEPDSEIVKYGSGLYQVQLELPTTTSLTQTDVDRILQIASWEGGNIRDKINGYEGMRSVVIDKENVSYSNGTPLRGLQVSGIGYVPTMKKVTPQAFIATSPVETMQPPSTENFLSTFPQVGATTSIVNGRIVPEKRDYAPTGAYAESEMRRKIAKTREVNDGRFGFSVPAVEAYGRYLNMTHGDEHLGFLVFSIPDPTLPRFAEYTTKNFKGTVNDLNQYMFTSANTLGRTAREMHDAGFVHRQLHLANFYTVNGKLHIMDWSTKLPVAPNDMRTRTIDIRIPQQSVETLMGLYLLQPDEASLISITFSTGMMQGYFGDDKIDLLQYLNRMVKAFGGTSTSFIDDRAVIESLMAERFGLRSFRDGNVRNHPCPCGSGSKFKKCHGK